MSDAYEPDQATLDLLQAEHEHGAWIGPRLLSIANRVKNRGGSEEDFLRWVKSSHLWLSYQGNTKDRGAVQRQNLERAWDKAEDSETFDAEESLDKLAEVVASAPWVGRSGSRNRTVALAFIAYCADRNCFTRTISQYELAKYTPGLSPKTVQRALVDLVKLGLLVRIERTDKRPSSRATGRYRINLSWKPSALRSPRSSTQGSYTSDSMSTRKTTLSQLRNNAGQDVWSTKGLGLTASRVYDVLADEPATIADIAVRAGLSYQAARYALLRLADNALAGVIPGRPVRYFLVETPLSAVADMLGVSGYVAEAVYKIEVRQKANREGYPSAYWQPAS